MRDFHHPGRSTVHGKNGAIATSHPAATLAGLDMLRTGGNAIDAAIAASAVLCVVEPMMTGIGGDCFALIAKNGKSQVLGLNGSGHAPAGSNAQTLRDAGLDKIPVHSPHAVTIPGAVAAWEKLLADHGTKSLGDVLQPAIRAALDGYVLSPRVSVDWMFLAPLLEPDAGAAANFLANGKAPALGSLFKTPALGRTLEAIAEQGAKAFYDSAITDDMVATLQAKGGVHTRDDFAAIAPKDVTPITTDYRGKTLHEIPPNGQGITAQIILNILEGFDYTGMDPVGADRYHLLLEAQRIAFSLRDTYVADPDHADVPIEDLLSKTLAEKLRGAIDPAKRNEALPDPSLVLSDTIYLSVIDKDRTAVSFINSVYAGFGSCICAPQSGVMFQNRGAGFSLQAGHLNELAPNKRPMHTIIPAMVTQGDKALLSYGVMGGEYQPMGHAQVLQNLVDFGMDLQEAIDCPRVLFDQGKVQAELSISDAAYAGLEAKGHPVVRALIPHGGGQAVMIDHEHDTLLAASDPRKDGCALAY